MIALLLAATAVAVSARRYAAQQVEGVALLKCLGASQALVLAATLLELAIIGVATGIAGSALGYLAQFGLGSLVEDLMELELPAPGLAPGVERHLRRARGARRVRDARDAVAAHRAAAARAAPGRGAESGADGRVLRGRGRRRARPARVARRHERDARRVGRRAWRRRRAALCRGARARQAHRAAAQRRGGRVALWTREHRTPPRRQRRAGDGVRLRAHGAAAPVGRADRPARHVVRVAADRCAEPFHDQHPARGSRRHSRAVHGARPGGARARAHGARPAHRDRRRGRHEPPHARRGRLALPRGEPDLGRGARCDERGRRRRVVGARHRARRDLGRRRHHAGARARARRRADLRDRRLRR